MKRKVIYAKKPLYHITTARFADRVERFAASELQKYIYSATDVCLPYFSDRCEKRTPEILIGKDARSNNICLDKVVGDGFVIKTEGRNVIIAGKTSKGTLNGVYSFLERFFNFRRFTFDVEKIERMRSLIVDDMYILENPDFEYREVYTRLGFDKDFSSKNKLNSNLAEYSDLTGMNMRFYNCHHSFSDLVPFEKYGKTHPEYYSEVDGKRISENYQLCLTNEEVIKISTEKVKEWIRENPDCKIFSVAQNDCYNFCTCEKCKEIDDKEQSNSGSIIYFVNRIAEEIEKEYPDVLIHTFAYTYSVNAPKFVKPRKNVIVRLCNFGVNRGIDFVALLKKDDEGAVNYIENLNRWSDICSHLYVWEYIVNFKHYLIPFPNIYAMAENIKYYKRRGIKGLLLQGNFSYGNTSSLTELKTYVFARLLWNSELDVSVLIKEFTDAVYGNSAECMREYVELLHSIVGDKYINMYNSADQEYYTDEFIQKAEEIFEKALKLEKNKIVKERIQREYLSIMYLKACRLEVGDSRKAKLCNELEKWLRYFKFTEIQERTLLDVSLNALKNIKNYDVYEGRYTLYYEMR